MIFNADKIEKLIEYYFKDKNLLKRAFTHKSYVNEKGGFDNERLEFLGDSVLGYIVSEYLYLTDKDNEGRLTLIKQNLVSTNPLSNACLQLKINEYLLVGESLKKSINEKHLCENLFEALVGAIYLDGGLEVVKQFVNKFLLKKNKNITSFTNDNKSKLQILLQSKKMSLPKYEIISKIGPDHNPEFIVGVYVDGKLLGQGQGKNKAEASQNGAENVLNNIGRKNK